MMINDIERILNKSRSVKRSNHAMLWNAWDTLTASFPVLRVFWRSNMASAMEKYLLKTPGNRVSETLNSKMSLDASVLNNLCLWCEFQSRLLFVISLPLKNFLTALYEWYIFQENTRVYIINVNKNCRLSNHRHENLKIPACIFVKI